MRMRFHRHYLVAHVILSAALLAICALPGPVQSQDAAQPTDQSPESVVVLAAGDIAKCNVQEDAYTGALLDNLPGTILGLGDNDQNNGSLQDFNDCYGPTWGRFKDRVYPVTGNHEYLTGGAEGYFTYFGDRATPLEPGCRKECKGYYSFDLGAWHIVALNSQIDINAGSEQDLWFRADLAAHPNVCTLAYWHKPRWSSGYHGSGASAPLFQAAYDYGVDIVLSGHDHDYERFAPQSPQGVLEPDRGVRQFVVGTGGDPHRGWYSSAPNSEVKDPDSFGVLKLTLHPTSYDWEFIPIAGQTFTDSGSGNCVTYASAPVPPAAVPISTGASPIDVQSDAVASSAATLPTEGLDYVVQAGDTLSLIAMRYGLDWEVVAQVDGITNTEVIEVGQVIHLPGVTQAAAATVTPAPALVSTVPTTTTAGAFALATPTPVPGTVTTATTSTVASAAATGTSYTVVAGDTLFGIALRSNVSLQELAAANHMQESDLLKIGQTLVIPGHAVFLPTPTPRVSTLLAPTATPKAGTASGSRVYTVVEGDTIIAIALKLNVDWEDLLAVNGLQPDSMIQVGQDLRLP